MRPAAGLRATLAIGAGAALGMGLFAPACGTVDLGDNIVPPSVRLDEDFFYCRIQPEIIVAQGCATGMAGDTGGCHLTQSALLLEDAAGVMAPACDADGAVLPGEIVPDVYMRNLTRVRFTVASDPESSPFYRRPLQLDSHPRAIFALGSAEELLVAEWIGRGSF